MNRLIAVVIAVLAVVLPSAAQADYLYYPDANQRYIDDLNMYTLQAPKIVQYGKTALYFPERTGQPVTIIGRGKYDPALGGSGYLANYVIVGHPCSDCTAQTTVYHTTSSGLDDIIVVYP